MSLKKFPGFLLNFSEREMAGEAKHFYHFKSFRLNIAERQLLRNNSPISLTPKAFDVLALLVEQNGHLVEKDELLKQVWADSFVEEANIARLIHTLRRTLGEDVNGNKFIETVAKKGYRFVAEVQSEPPAVAGGLSESVEPFTKVEIANRPPLPSIDISRLNDNTQPPPTAGGSDTHKPQTRFVLFTFGFATAISLILLLSFNFWPGAGAKAIKTKSIAVLPVRPLTAENREPIYEFGIADSLIYKIGTAKNLTVRDLSATRKYSGVDQDALRAGGEQQVDFVLASNYQLAGGKIRITSQLFNVATGQVEENYKGEKDAGTLFATQDAIAGEIGNILLARFDAASNTLTAKRGTTNEEAYRLYLQGMFMNEKRSLVDAKRATELFDQALTLDPNYAKAWAGKAFAHCHFSHMGGSSPDVEYTLAKPAIERAMALDDKLPEVYAVLGVIRTDYDWNFAEGEKQFLRAIGLAPNTEFIHRWYALRLAGQGRFEEAIAQIKTVIDLNPSSINDQINYGRILYFAGRDDDAITQFRRVLEIDSARPGVYGFLWRIYHLKGDEAQAYQSFTNLQRLLNLNDDDLRSYEATYKKGGWKDVLRRYLEILKTDPAYGSDSYYIAELSALTDQSDQAFRFLDDAVNNRSAEIPNIISEPSFDSLRDDPRYDDLVARVGLK